MEGPVRTLGVSGNSTHKESRCWSGPEGTCAPAQAGLSASLVNSVSGPAQLDWSRRCVLLTRGLRIPWGILCGSLKVSGDSAGKAPPCSSGPEWTCAYIQPFKCGFWIELRLGLCSKSFYQLCYLAGGPQHRHCLS